CYFRLLLRSVPDFPLPVHPRSVPDFLLPVSEAEKKVPPEDLLSADQCRAGLPLSDSGSEAFLRPDPAACSDPPAVRPYSLSDLFLPLSAQPPEVRLDPLYLPGGSFHKLLRWYVPFQPG